MRIQNTNKNVQRSDHLKCGHLTNFTPDMPLHLSATKLQQDLEKMASRVEQFFRLSGEEFRVKGTHPPFLPSFLNT